ncbi:MAG: hypothetical protein EHJ95_07645 [Methanobacteriota archaeon]|nr:MAG: hypothetical protein EHJ95_07645 [Euryarchaeota archaeon]
MSAYPYVIGACVLASILAAGCLSDNQAAEVSSRHVSVAIVEEISNYSIVMSSTPGLGLTAVVNGSAPDASIAYYRWTTDYGEFLGWSAPDYRVRELGSNVGGNVTKVYWTYLSRADDAVRPDVHVSLEVIDAGSGRSLGRAERTIVWMPGSVAHIT